MRLGLSSLISVLFFIPIHFASAANDTSTISMLREHTPCGNGQCIQRCNYDADALIEYQGFEIEGKVTIRSDFDSKTNPDKVQLRTLVNVSVDMVGANAYWDETSIFDAATMRLEKTYNFIKAGTGSGDKGLRKAEWSETKFSYPNNYVGVPTATVRAIGGKSGDEIKRKFPKFYKFLKDSSFGADWMSEFEDGNPERKPERDMMKFPENVLSPTFVSLYHLRFIPIIPALKYNLFVNYAPDRRDFGAFQVGLEGRNSGKANEGVFEGELAFGDFESIPGKPAKFYVDKSTNEFTRIELSMQNTRQGLKADAWTTRVSCQTFGGK